MSSQLSRRANPKLRRALGARVRALRARKQLSQNALGDRSRLSGKFIGELERGAKSISMDSASRVAKALGVTLPELVTLT